MGFRVRANTWFKGLGMLGLKLVFGLLDLGAAASGKKLHHPLQERGRFRALGLLDRASGCGAGSTGLEAPTFLFEASAYSFLASPLHPKL